jgi:hypothetical protein
VTLPGAASLTCKQVVELVTELLSDVLPVEDRVRVEQHLLVCPPCTLHLSQMRSTVDFASRLRAASPVAPSPALVDLFRQWKAKGASDDDV